MESQLKLGRNERLGDSAAFNVLRSIYSRDYVKSSLPLANPDQTTFQLSTSGLPMKIRTPNIVFIILESTGLIYTPLSDTIDVADMPFLKKLAANSINITSARTVFPHTTKAVFGILSGQYPVPDSYLSETELNFPVTGLPEYLSTYGYSSVFFQSALGTFERRPVLIKNLGFDEFITASEINPEADVIGAFNVDDFVLKTGIEKWMQNKKEPFVMGILTSITHHPYTTPSSNDITYAPYRNSTGDENRNRYYKTLTYSDTFIESVFKTIHDLDTNPDGTLYVIVGDHGEGFGQHGLYAHSLDSYDETLRVPLIFNWQGTLAPRAIHNQQFSTIDILPTIFALLGGSSASSTLPGVNMLADKPTKRNIFYTSWSNSSGIGLINEHALKYIYNLKNHIYQKFDTSVDPNEQHDLSSDMSREEKISIENALLNWKNINSNGGFDRSIATTSRVYNWQCQPTGDGECVKVTNLK